MRWATWRLAVQRRRRRRRRGSLSLLPADPTAVFVWRTPSRRADSPRALSDLGCLDCRTVVPMYVRLVLARGGGAEFRI